MESDRSWEQNTLRNELIQGMEVARKLKAELQTESSAENRDLLVQRLISSYDRSLLILKRNASFSNSQSLHQATITSSPESLVPVSMSSPRENIDGALKDNKVLKKCSKKRKEIPKWVDQVKVNSDSGTEGYHKDGYSWRKYGQKVILGAKYSRSYYRCTFRSTKGCSAKKQVQRSDKDSTILDITYRGSHTCSKGNNAVLPPPDVQEVPHSHNNDIHHAQPSKESPTNFSDILTVPSNSFGHMKQENHGLPPSILEDNSLLSSLSQTHLLSPNTPEPNYFPSSVFQMNEFDGIYSKPCLESDVAEIISTITPTANSPKFDLDFPLEPEEIDPKFPFHSYNFFQ